MGRWDAVKNIPPFDATTISAPTTTVALVTSPEPKGRDGGGQQRTERDARRPTTSGDTS